MISSPSPTETSSPPLASYAYNIFPLGSLDVDPLATLLPGNSLTYAVGGGTTTLLFFKSPPGLRLADMLLRRSPAASGGVSSVGDFADMDYQFRSLMTN